MNGLFTVKEWIFMLGNFTGPDGVRRCSALGVMVIITVGDRSRRATRIGGQPMIASRDALHEALGEFFPNLKKVKVPRGEERKVWAAIVSGYNKQLA